VVRYVLRCVTIFKDGSFQEGLHPMRSHASDGQVSTNGRSNCNYVVILLSAQYSYWQPLYSTLTWLSIQFEYKNNSFIVNVYTTYVSGNQRWIFETALSTRVHLRTTRFVGINRCAPRKVLLSQHAAMRSCSLPVQHSLFMTSVHFNPIKFPRSGESIITAYI
jgi:hypothetical protein